MAPSRAQRCLVKNDILYSCVRPYQHNNYIFKMNEKVVASTGFAVLRGQPSSTFLYSLIDSKIFESKVMDRCTGTSYPAINSSSLSSIVINYPNKEEQIKIGNFLEVINARIKTQNKIIEDLKTYRNSLIDQYFRNCEKNISLKKVLRERKTFSEKGLEYEHVTLSKDGIIPKGERYDRDFLVKDDSKEYKITKLNDICYNPANLKFGVICLNDYGDSIFSPIYVTFEVSNFDPYYVSLYLTSKNFINYILKYQQGTVYERMAVSPEDLVEGKLPFDNNIKNFSNLIRAIDLKIKTESNLMQKYNLQKTYLLQNLFI